MTSTAFHWLIALPLIASACIYLAGRIGFLRQRNQIAQVAGFASLLATWIPFLAKLV